MSDIIKLIVTNAVTFIDGKLKSQHYQGLKKALGYRPEDSNFMVKAFQKKKGVKWKWDGLISTVCYSKKFCKCPIKHDGTHFPSGLLSKAREFFTKNNISYSLVDKREKVDKNLSLRLSEDFEIRDYQQGVIEDAIKRGRGIIKVSTGGGKTGIASAIIANLSISPTIFYVTSLDLLKQAKAELERFIRDESGKSIEVGAIGGGICDIRDINVMTVQTAVRALGGKFKPYDDEEEATEEDVSDIIKEKREAIKELITNAKVLVADECHHWQADVCQTITGYSLDCRYRFGASATPFRDMGDDILIDACFGKTIADINASFLIDKGFLVQPKIYMVNIKEDKPLDVKTYQSIYQQRIVENAYRNNIIAEMAKKFRDQGRLVLVLCRIIAHGHILNNLIPGSVFLHGSSSSKERQSHLKEMRERKAGVTISSSIFDEGIDVRPLDTLILAGSGKSQTRALQRIGRTLRPYPGKKDAIVVDFIDHVKYMKQHSNKRMKIYKTEPRFEIEKINV